MVKLHKEVARTRNVGLMRARRAILAVTAGQLAMRINCWYFHMKDAQALAKAKAQAMQFALRHAFNVKIDPLREVGRRPYVSTVSALLCCMACLPPLPLKLSLHNPLSPEVSASKKTPRSS